MERRAELRLAARAASAATRGKFLFLNALQGAWFTPRLVRWALLRAWGVDAATHRINEGCWFGGTEVSLGRGTFVNMRCVFDNWAPISIGANCYLGMGVSLVTSTHELGPSGQRAGAVSGKPIVVGDGCWIGANAIVLPGVTIGPGCIIGAGAVVSKDCEPDGLYAGNPARRVRDLA